MVKIPQENAFIFFYAVESTKQMIRKDPANTNKYTANLTKIVNTLRYPSAYKYRTLKELDEYVSTGAFSRPLPLPPSSRTGNSAPSQ